MVMRNHGNDDKRLSCCEHTRRDWNTVHHLPQQTYQKKKKANTGPSYDRNRPKKAREREAAGENIDSSWEESMACQARKGFDRSENEHELTALSIKSNGKAIQSYVAKLYLPPHSAYLLHGLLMSCGGLSCPMLVVTFLSVEIRDEGA